MASTKSMVDMCLVFLGQRSSRIRCWNLHLVSLQSSDSSEASTSRSRATAVSTSAGENATSLRFRVRLVRRGATHAAEPDTPRVVAVKTCGAGPGRTGNTSKIDGCNAV
eukprot:3934212-Rhodomonas_salina.1